MINHELLIEISNITTLIKSTDYMDYGGDIERWKDNDNYPDCSMGCKWFAALDGPLGNDWGVCVKLDSPRTGLLTFEHQAGHGCFEGDD